MFQLIGIAAMYFLLFAFHELHEKKSFVILGTVSKEKIKLITLKINFSVSSWKIVLSIVFNYSTKNPKFNQSKWDLKYI